MMSETLALEVHTLHDTCRQNLKPQTQVQHLHENLLRLKEKHLVDIFNTMLTITLLDHSFAPQATDKFQRLTQ